MKRQFSFALILFPVLLFGQGRYWQQEISYEMDIDLNDEKHQIQGVQEVKYYNNSPDTLFNIYYHLYFNAFKPGSMMDVRSRTIEDPDARVGSRIASLSKDEQGFVEVVELLQNGQKLSYETEGTILEVKLNTPILPGKKAKFRMEFVSQIPVQIRRSGRDNREGVDYSMAQWYPKVAEYDYMGWHADPYVAREFHGVWGDFDVTIHLDSAYTIGATGVLQNAREIGHGYVDDASAKVKLDSNGKLAWNFTAENVHDFVWAADKDYVHTKLQVENGPMLHFLYLDEPDIADNWERLPAYTARIYEYASATFGEYPYPQYSVIQGGDGGMEYPMATLITGRRKFSSLVGVTVHESMHEWYHTVLASNEGLYPWMDEGFCTFSSSKVMSHLFNPEEDTRVGSYYNSYLNLAASDVEEPMYTMADHFETNYAYSASTYGKGAVFVAQLGCIIGEDNLMRGLRRYFEEWKFKHPTPNDFIRVMEKTSGTHLKWYLNYMLGDEHIDYAIKRVEGKGDKTIIELRNNGGMPMPVDIDILTSDSSRKQIHIPLGIMRNTKPKEDVADYTVAEDWPWTSPVYILEVDLPISEVREIEIDKSGRLADVNREDNIVRIEAETQI
ncbi:MAG TPA: M1 family metallopeptidase, partial [Cryomorphaceae bacterium]|nr:M1 family metallopeptidase [Cryomorphaceae bacterium]